MQDDLRPLTLGELLDRAFLLYRSRWALFVGIMVVPSVFSMVPGLCWISLARLDYSSGDGAKAVALAMGFVAFGILSGLPFLWPWARRRMRSRSFNWARR